MNYLLDTCVLSELFKKKPNQTVVDWFAQQEEHTLYLSVLTLGELEKGIAKLPPSKRKKSIQTWVEEDLFSRFENRILGITAEVAISWGKIQGEAEKKGRPMPAIDSLISATALTHNMTLVTRNALDMEQSGASILDLWS